MPSNKPESAKPAAVLPASPATAPGVDAPPPSPPEPSRHRAPAPPFCKECGVAVEVYDGTNVHKLGTGWCRTHGRVAI